MATPDDTVPPSFCDSASPDPSIRQVRNDEDFSSPRAMVETWYYKVARDGIMTEHPISRSGLENLIRKGSLPPETLVRPKGDPIQPQFLRLADWPEFANFFSVDVSAAPSSIEMYSSTTEWEPTIGAFTPTIDSKSMTAIAFDRRSLFVHMPMWLTFLGFVGAFNLWYYLAVVDPPYNPPSKSDRGFQVREWTNPQGETFKYAAFIPHYYEQRPYFWGLWNRPRRPPVLVFLHGFGDFDAGGVRAVKSSIGSEVWEKKRRFPFVVVFPQLRMPTEWSAHGQGFAVTMGILEHLKGEFDTDSSRVYLTGLSSGGDGCLEFASMAPGRFAAIAPSAAGSHLAGRFSTIEETAKEFAKIRLPIWFSYNDGDQARVSGYLNQLYISAMTDAGAPPKTTVYAQIGHGSWEPFHRSPEFYPWLLSHTTATLRLPDPRATKRSQNK